MIGRFGGKQGLSIGEGCDRVCFFYFNNNNCQIFQNLNIVKMILNNFKQSHNSVTGKREQWLRVSGREKSPWFDSHRCPITIHFLRLEQCCSMQRAGWMLH